MTATADAVSSAKQSGIGGFNPKRVIGIRPRVKVTTKGEERPTQVYIHDLETGQKSRFEIKDEQDEFDFIVWGKWPVNGKFRDVVPDEDLSAFLKHHVIWDDPGVARDEGREIQPTQVPVAYEGARPGDLIATSLGGLGDCLSYALSKRGEREDGSIQVFRIPPYMLKERRPTDYKDDDAVLLVELVQSDPGLFFNVTDRDRAMITLRETERLRRYIMKDRIACNNRVCSNARTMIWCSEEAYPEGEIEALYDAAIASDPVLQALVEKEKKLVRQLTKLMNVQPLYAAVEDEKGLGPMTLSSIIAAITDIRRFPTVGKFKAYCGLHVRSDGSFPRRRHGERCSWPTWVRQAFYLLGESFVKNSKKEDAYWGRRLVHNKVEYREKHPYPVLVEGSYSNGNGNVYDQGDGMVTSENGGLTNGNSTEKEPKFVPTGCTFNLIPGQFSWDKRTGRYTVAIDHGEVVTKGKQRYTKAHIHRMAVWRTVSEFAEWLYWKWRTLEGLPARPPRAFPSKDTDAVKAAVTEWEKQGTGVVKLCPDCKPAKAEVE